MQKGATGIRWFGLLTLLAFVALFTALYVGFYYPDPYFYRGATAGGHKLLLLAVQIMLPVAALLLLIIAVMIAKRKLPLSGLMLGVAGLLLGLLMLHSAADLAYFRLLSKRSLDKYHPFLQLAPAALPVAADLDRSGILVFALGGSTTAWKDSSGLGWPERVELELAGSAPRGRKVRVYNLATEWYTSAHSLINYALNLHSYHPDVILLMHGINDLLINADFSYYSAGPFVNDYRHFYGPLISTLKPPQGPFKAVYEKLKLAWYHRPRQSIDTEAFPGLHSFAQNINSLIDLAEAHRTRVVLITQPYLFKENVTTEEMDALYMLQREAVGPRARWSLNTALSGMRQYNSMLKQIAKKRNLPLIDLESAIPKTLEYLKDDVHYTDKSFPLIAQRVAAGLIQARVLKKSTVHR